MYLKKAIERINSIREIECTEDRDTVFRLVECYLMNLAAFFYNENKKPINPMYCNIAYFLGDDRDLDLEHYGSFNIDYSMFFIRFYLQLADFAEKNAAAEKYVNIYDPIITLKEKGCKFYRAHGCWEFYGYFAMPLSHNDWYDRYVDKAKEKGLIV